MPYKNPSFFDPDTRIKSFHIIPLLILTFFIAVICEFCQKIIYYEIYFFCCTKNIYIYIYSKVLQNFCICCIIIHMFFVFRKDTP